MNGTAFEDSEEKIITGGLRKKTRIQSTTKLSLSLSFHSFHIAEAEGYKLALRYGQRELQKKLTSSDSRSGKVDY